MPNTNHNELPPKEQNLFKSVVRFYETKQLKKAFKAADTILKRFPNHGETLAMKGLTLNALDKKDEATDFVRRGLRMNLQSHICWHVYGLLYRSDREYRDAAKAYLQALKFDKDNQQILRDLALLQIQIRDYDGLEETRRTLLTVRPNQRNNWIGFALSFHLLGNYATAVSVLDTYQDTLKQSNEPEDRYEASELLLYKNMVLEESGDLSAALAHLDEVSPKLVDRLAVLETRARLQLALGRYEECTNNLMCLLKINPDNRIYHKGLHVCAIRSAKRADGVAVNGDSPVDHQVIEDLPTAAASTEDFGRKKVAALERRVLGISPVINGENEANIAIGVCNSLTTQFRSSRTAPRLVLDLLPDGDHPQFTPRLDAYVRRFLRKGVPSLFSDIQPLYANPSKAKAIGKLFESYRQALEDEGKKTMPESIEIPDVDEKVSKILSSGGSIGADGEPSCTLLWVLHFLAQHYERLGLREIALEVIDAAISHTPTAIECYLVKGKILRNCGDYKGAVKVLDEARNLDLADRYLNTICSEYALDADMVSTAEGWVGLFTRDADSGGVQALYDMQCMWFELGSAESHLRRGQWGLALKKFTAVDRHFADMVEDQFDFHSYCLRKVTLRAYVSLLRFEDRIRSHPYYARAACGIVECLLRLHGLPEKERVVITGEHADIAGYAEMSASERKKAASKRKKEMHRKRQGKQGGGGGKGSGRQGKGSGKQANAGADKRNNESKLNSGGTSDNKTKTNQGWMEQDPHGIERLQELFKKDKGKDKLYEDASKIIRELQMHLPGHLRTQVVSFDVALWGGKHLRALRAVKRAQRIDNENPDTLMISIKLAHMLTLGDWKDSMSDIVREVYAVEGDVLNGKSMLPFVESYEERNGEFAERRLGAGKCRLWMSLAGVEGSSSTKDAAEKIIECIESSDDEGIGSNVLLVGTCRSLVVDVKRMGVEKDVLERIKKACKAKYPRATCFE